MLMVTCINGYDNSHNRVVRVQPDSHESARAFAATPLPARERAHTHSRAHTGEEQLSHGVAKLMSCCSHYFPHTHQRPDKMKTVHDVNKVMYVDDLALSCSGEYATMLRKGYNRYR